MTNAVLEDGVDWTETELPLFDAGDARAVEPRLVAEADGVIAIGAQPVDRDLQHQPRLLGGICGYGDQQTQNCHGHSMLHAHTPQFIRRN